MAYCQRVIFLAMCFCVWLPVMVGCSPAPPMIGADPAVSNRIVVTNYPLFEFTNRVVDGLVTVDYVGPEQGDVKDWAPATEKIRELQKADLIIVNGPGAQFANWLTFVTIDPSKLCKTADVLDLLEFIVVKEFKIVHSHGPEGEHSHNWVVPNCWLDPLIAKRQCAEIVRRLSEVYPDHQSEFESNLVKLNLEFDSLEEQVKLLAAKVNKLSTKSVVSSDPRLRFLTRAVELEDKSFLWFEPVGEGQAKTDVESMLKELDDRKPNAFLWVGNENKSAELHHETVKALTGNSTAISPIEFPPASGDYFSVMKSNLERLTALVE